MRTASCTSTCFFFFNATATTEIYTLSLHDALPIFGRGRRCRAGPCGTREVLRANRHRRGATRLGPEIRRRSEEHTSELQSQFHLVCRLLLEKKKESASSSRMT